MAYNAWNMGEVKKKNRSMILKCINEAGSVSRKDIAQLTGLTPAAVTQICNHLIEQGLLVELGVLSECRGAGRRKVLLDLNRDYAYVISVNMEPEKTVIAFCNMAGDALERRELMTDRSCPPRKFLKSIADVCRALTERHPEETRKLIGVSVGITGPVDREQGISLHAYGIWEEPVAVGSMLAEMLHQKVMVENNVNAFAVAELLFGLGRVYDNLMVVKWGPGVGSTIVIDHNVYDGRHGKAAEIGHVIVDKDGIPCSCGRRGCLETIISHKALGRIRPFAPEDFGNVYADASANEAGQFEEAIDLFARTIVNMMTMLAPNRVVLTGSMFGSSKIRDALVAACSRYDDKYDHNRILYTELATRADYIGPVAAFLQKEIF